MDRGVGGGFREMSQRHFCVWHRWKSMELSLGGAIKKKKSLLLYKYASEKNNNPERFENASYIVYSEAFMLPHLYLHFLEIEQHCSTSKFVITTNSKGGKCYQITQLTFTSFQENQKQSRWKMKLEMAAVHNSNELFSGFPLPFAFPHVQNDFTHSDEILILLLNANGSNLYLK